MAGWVAVKPPILRFLGVNWLEITRNRTHCPDVVPYNGDGRLHSSQQLDLIACRCLPAGLRVEPATLDRG